MMNQATKAAKAIEKELKEAFPAIKMFKDTSIFQGVKEFVTPHGNLRVMNEGTMMAVYQEKDKCFQRLGTISKTKSTVEIWQEALKAGFFN
jgi:hypothetical protein